MSVSRVSIVLMALLFCTVVTHVNAITIRDDLTEADYIALATDPKWASAGVYTSTSTCFASGGTLIHPEWSITAGHCLNGTAEFVLGADRDNPEVQVPVVSTDRHMGFDGSNVGNGKDLGLSHLASPVLDVTPVRLYRGSAEQFKTVTVLGYGQFGTGITGDNQGGIGIRRAAENRIDIFGNSIGQSIGVMITDFDNPVMTPGDNFSGPATPLPFEGGIAFYDSGSGWFMDIDGITYLVGVTSFRAFSTADGMADSDYGDIFGGTRVSRELTWIDDHHDVTQFWDQSTGNWNQDSKWLPGAQPGVTNAAVIDGGSVTVTDTGEIAEYTFVVQTGELELQNNFATVSLLLREGGRVEVNNPSSATTLIGNMRQGADGTLAVNIRTGDTVGSGYDQFFVSGDAEIDGTLEVLPSGLYNDPSTRGDSDEFVLLVAGNLVGEFDQVDYDGTSLVEGINYVGTSSGGDDGMFRNVAHVGNQVVLENHLARLGDANGDGFVDGADFLVWNDNKFNNGDWSEGDFTGDGLIDGDDFLAWNNNKFTAPSPASVPEPGGCVLVLGSLLALAGRQRRARARGYRGYGSSRDAGFDSPCDSLSSQVESRI